MQIKNQYEIAECIIITESYSGDVKDSIKQHHIMSALNKTIHLINGPLENYALLYGIIAFYFFENTVKVYIWFLLGGATNICFYVISKLLLRNINYFYASWNIFNRISAWQRYTVFIETQYFIVHYVFLTLKSLRNWDAGTNKYY